MRVFTDVPLDNKFAYIYQQGGHPIRLPEQAISGKNMAFVEPDEAWKASGDRIIMQKGEPSQCHTNSAMLWEANKSRTLEGPYREELALATGYAMSEDGLWRQHSWCVLRTPARVKVVETTVPRVAYYGFVMTHAEAERFAERSV